MYTVIRKFIVPSVSIGWSSTIAIMLFVGGLIMLMLGMIGEYIGRIYISINNSPQYVVREIINTDEDELVITSVKLWIFVIILLIVSNCF
jgi:undecaprenyl-phosphate 4-deoxy-4-formamido-L-arabinose transferase